MLDYPAAQAVAAVVRCGSFEQAARLLNVTPSAVSQRVKGLEERLGTALVVRGTPCRATAAGDWLCRHVENVGLLEAELFAQLPGGPGAEGPVTVAMATNADSLATWLPAALAGFARDTGHLLSVLVSDEQDTAEMLRQGRVLAAVTGLEQPVAGCLARPLGRLAYCATASPDFVARHFPGGVTAAALARAPSLAFDPRDRLQRRWAERVVGQAVDLPVHWVPTPQAFVDLGLHGMGWSMNPENLVREHLATGRLVDLWPGLGLEVPLFWQVSRLAAGPLAPLTRAVMAAGLAALV